MSQRDIDVFNGNGSLISLVLVGNAASGKSCLIIRFVAGRFISDYEPTLEDSYRKVLEVDGTPVCIDVFDTAGSEEFAATRQSYIKKSEGVICVYSIDNLQSFQDVPKWFQEIRFDKRLSDSESFPSILVGNKCDLKEREVPTDKGEELALSLNCAFFETSALTGQNVDIVFEDISRKVLVNRRKVGKKKHKCIVM